MGRQDAQQDGREPGLFWERMKNWGLAFTAVVLALAAVWLSWLIFSEWQRGRELDSSLHSLWHERADLFERFSSVWREERRLKHDTEYQKRMLKRRMGYTEEGEEAIIVVEEE